MVASQPYGVRLWLARTRRTTWCERIRFVRRRATCRATPAASGTRMRRSMRAMRAAGTRCTPEGQPVALPCRAAALWRNLPSGSVARWVWQRLLLVAPHCIASCQATRLAALHGTSQGKLRCAASQAADCRAARARDAQPGLGAEELAAAARAGTAGGRPTAWHGTGSSTTRLVARWFSMRRLTSRTHPREGAAAADLGGL